MNSADLRPHELMQRVADFFESREIGYRVVGSMASMAYGEPRFTNDVDIVAELELEDVPLLIAAFPAPEFYVSETAAREAVARRFQFNIIHPASGLKVDVIVSQDTEFARIGASRARRIKSEGQYSAWFGSPEDVLLNKLIYYRLGGGISDKHIRDILGMIKLQGENIDRAYVDKWADKLGVAAEWLLACQRAQQTG
jgi:hypothetical protein